MPATSTVTEPLLTGYSDRWSVQPGQSVQFMISSDTAEVETQVVRLLHGDQTPGAPGLVEVDVAADVNGHAPGGLKRTLAGSYVISPPTEELSADSLTIGLSLWPTQASDELQTIVSVLDRDGSGWALRLVDRHLQLWVTSSSGHSLILGPELSLRQWCHVTIGLRSSSNRATLQAKCERGAGWADSSFHEGAYAPGLTAGPRRLVAAGEARAATDGEIINHFNGKLDSVWVAKTPDASQHWHSGMSVPQSSILCWDFSAGASSQTAVDVGPLNLDGQIVNAPTRAMTGPRWNGDELDPRIAPELWSAIHFHDDDLDDAGWPVAATWQVPLNTPSGIYALRLRTSTAEDHLVFVVRPLVGAPTSKALFLVPTLTYLAYANERLSDGGAVDVLAGHGPLEIHEGDLLLRRFPEWGRSVYDLHGDGSGVCHSSRLRPIPNFRPGYRFWSTGGPERLSADLYLTHFLDQHQIATDVVTDEDLHAEGQALLSPYDVVITGTHPEYWTGDMLLALESYLAQGGRLMYLGGNGFYWVTSLDPERPHLIEVRRGVSGTRAWTSQPGELHHATTGEPGGLWRFRGKDPNKLVGVAFASQSDSYDPAAGYEVLEPSPDVDFILADVDRSELIGEFGLINDGAAGYEIDRVDHTLGAPDRTIRIASSEGRHNDSYLLVVEDIECTHPAVTGSTSDRVRADLAYLTYPHGGAVFSVGSCNWGSALSHNDYDNNVSRVTLNVLRRFLESESS